MSPRRDRSVPREAVPEWTPRDAERVRALVGLGPLRERHWKVITTYREECARAGRPPGLEQLERLTGIGDREMHGLFPGDAPALIARLAGIAPPSAR